MRFTTGKLIFSLATSLDRANIIFTTNQSKLIFKEPGYKNNYIYFGIKLNIYFLRIESKQFFSEIKLKFVIFQSILGWRKQKEQKEEKIVNKNLDQRPNVVKLFATLIYKC